jgi:hypothetical protein
LVTIENANPYGILDEEKLSSFENRLEISLPKDYQEFLIKYNGGVPNPSGFWIMPGEDGSEVLEFYGLHEGPPWRSIDGYTNVELGIPEKLLPIGDDGVGNHICIGIKGEESGVVYFIDHEIHPYHNCESFEGITKLANSFSEFLNGLEVLPES